MADKFSNISTVMTLNVGITASDTSITVNDATGLPLTFPYRLAIGYETADVEIVLVTAAATNTLTITRGQEDTPARSHSTGSNAVLVWTAAHATAAMTHIEATQNIHGIGSGNSVVGTGTTQTLTNKTISGSSNTLTNIGNSAISSLDAAKLTGVMSVATTPVANVTGNWPIDSRSTGNLDIVTRTTGSLPIDTRSTGSLPVDTRTTGNLPGSRVASPIGPLAWTADGDTITQGATAAISGLSVEAGATATAPATFVRGIPGQPAQVLRRNNATSTGDLRQLQDESGGVLANDGRNGVYNAQGFVDKHNSADLSRPPALRLYHPQFFVSNATFTNVSGWTVTENNGFTVAGDGTITVGTAGIYLITFNVNWQLNPNGIRYALLNGLSGPSSLINNATGASDTNHGVAAMFRLTAGQIFLGQVYQSSGGGPLGCNNTWLEVCYLSR